MGDASAPLSANLTSKRNKRGLRICLTNNSLQPINAVIPHPRERIWLYKNGEPLNRDAFPMRWEEEPFREIAPGGTLIAEISLVPYWLEIAGSFRIECEVVYSIEGSSVRSELVAAILELELPSREQLRIEKDEAIRRSKGATISYVPNVLVISEDAESIVGDAEQHQSDTAGGTITNDTRD